MAVSALNSLLLTIRNQEQEIEKLHREVEMMRNNIVKDTTGDFPIDETESAPVEEPAPKEEKKPAAPKKKAPAKKAPAKETPAKKATPKKAAAKKPAAKKPAAKKTK